MFKIRLLMVCQQQNVFFTIAVAIAVDELYNTFYFRIISPILIRILDQNFRPYTLILKMGCQQRNVFLQSLLTNHIIISPFVGSKMFFYNRCRQTI